MADNNLARSRNDVPDFFADDDPLAELARIVGYDDLPVAAKPASAPRPAPAFNLEDELLREFERYDAPRLDPIHDISLENDAASQDGLYAPSEADDLAVQPEPRGFDFSEPTADPVPALVPWDDERPGWDGSNFSDEEPPVAIEPEFSASQPKFFDENARIEPVFDLPGNPSVNPVPVLEPETSVPAEPAFAQFDLADELESSIAAEPAQEGLEPLHHSEAMPAKGKGAYVPGFRMPLANFNMARRDVEPQLPLPPLAPEPEAVSRGFSGGSHVFDHKPDDQAPDSGLDFASHPALEPAAAPVAVEAAVAASTKSDASSSRSPSYAVVDSPAKVASAKDGFSALDELIYDVERYSLPAASSPSLSLAPKPLSPAMAATHMAAPASSVPAAVAAVSVTPAPIDKDSSEPPFVSPVETAATAAPEPVAVERDPFSDEEFELALNDLDLELDFDEIAFDDAVGQPVVAAPAVVAHARSSEPELPAQPEFAAAAEVEAVDDAETIADLPFDPAEITDSEDQVEAIAELDVPALPVEEPEQPPAYRPDYDLDIDSELASLVAASSHTDGGRPIREFNGASPVPASFQASVQPARAPSYSDLDDFERALEEDFRRSLAAPLAVSDQDDLHYAESDYVATVENARRSVRSWAVPLALAGFVVLGGAGAYAWLGNGVSAVVSGGEPVIIAADTDPVKVAPENPGGKTVPNQDKAVYDRVAGVTPRDPKQHSLISSSEEPVDVVQKTLMPDTLPLEGENDIEPTDVGETEDPRLLPQQSQQAAAPTDQQPVAVMPRKVKTMIVRPDGKLVEQEAPAPVVAVAETAKAPAAGAKVVDVASVPERLPASASSASAQPDPVSGAGAAGIVPVSTPSNPTPSANSGAPKTNQITAPATPAPLTALPSAAAPAAAVAQTPPQAAAPAVPARTPVPASRPAEQPVNVVAAVTDQGTVRASGQIASAQAAVPSAPAALSGDGGYVIQIASLPSQAEAQKSYQSLSSKFGGVIGGRGVDIKSAEIAGKGTFYRVRIPAGSRNDAVALCEKYRSAGGSCLVAR